MYMNTNYYSVTDVEIVSSIVSGMSRSTGPELGLMIHEYTNNHLADDQNLTINQADLILRVFCLAWNLELDKIGETYFITGHNLPKRYSIVRITESELLECSNKFDSAWLPSIRLLAARSNPNLFDRLSDFK